MSNVRLGDVAMEVRETAKNPTGMPVVGLEHLIPGEIELSQWAEDSDNTFTRVFRKGQVLFGRRRAYQKKASIASVDGVCSGDITVIAAKEEKLLPELLPFIVNDDRFFDFAMEKSAGSLSPRVKWGQLAEYSFELPESIEKQRELASLLWAIERSRKAYKELERQADDLVKSQFVEQLSSHSKWPVVKLEQICDSIVRGPFGSALKVGSFVKKGENTVKVYEQKNAIQRSADIGDSYVSYEKYEELKRFECGPGDYIMSCSGTIGCLYQLPNTAERGIINQALCKFHLNNQMLPELFLLYMRNSVDQLETKGTAIKNIGAVSYIKNMEVVLPPMSEQEKIADYLRQIDESCFAIKQASESLLRSKTAIMRNVFS